MANFHFHLQSMFDNCVGHKGNRHSQRRPCENISFVWLGTYSHSQFPGFGDLCQFVHSGHWVWVGFQSSCVPVSEGQCNPLLLSPFSVTLTSQSVLEPRHLGRKKLPSIPLRIYSVKVRLGLVRRILEKKFYSIKF